MVRVKICGITNAADAACAVAAGADALGFIFYPKSPRCVTPGAAAAIVSGLPPFVTPVGVFVNVAPDAVTATVRESGLRCAQLHGDESPADCARVKAPVIRAMRVGADFDTASLDPYVDAGVTTFLLDTAKEGYYGGTGETFDWSAARAARDALSESGGRIILSGGLTADNVADGVRGVAPYAVDAGSGVEAGPGRKDHDKVRAFIRAARGSTT